MRGKLLVVSGPSGAGLREIVGAVLEGRGDCGAVTPVTSRKRKPGEVDGVGFCFYDLEQWQVLQESGDLLETTTFAGNDYGTSRRLVEEQLAAGRHVVLTLEVERAALVKQNMPEAVCVYMEPSEPAVLERRLREHARSSYECRVRLETARRERALSGFCDRRIPTDEPEKAVRELHALLDE